MEAQFTEGIVFLRSSNILHGSNTPFRLISSSDESIATFPEGVGDIAFSLEIADTELPECPRWSGYIIGIKLQHSGEIAPTEDIVDPLGIDSGDPLRACFFAVSDGFVGDEGRGVFLNP